MPQNITALDKEQTARPSGIAVTTPALRATPPRRGIRAMAAELPLRGTLRGARDLIPLLGGVPEGRGG